MKQRIRRIREEQAGFSLVELVVVMTIMAVLVGIVATRVLPYMEKANEAKDLQVTEAFCTAAMDAYIASGQAGASEETYTTVVTKTSTGWVAKTTDSTGAENMFIETNFYEASGINTRNPVFLSKEGNSIHKITIICKPGSPMVKLTVEGPQNPAAFAVDAN